MSEFIKKTADADIACENSDCTAEIKSGDTYYQEVGGTKLCSDCFATVESLLDDSE
jgi:hypothetical protein